MLETKTQGTLSPGAKSQDIIKSISEKEALAILRQEMKRKIEVPNIETFVKDPYYLGSIYNKNGFFSLYPNVIDWLYQVFGNDVTHHSIISLSGATGCVDCNTEFFDGKRWKYISNYIHGDKVLQYNPSTKEATLVYPEQYKKRPQTEFNLFQSHKLSMCLDDEHLHSFVYKNRSKWHIKKVKDIIKSHNKSKIGWGGLTATSFLYDGAGLSLSDAEIKVMLAVIADGCFKTESTNHCTIRVKKQSKIQELRKILKEANIKYHEKSYANYNISKPGGKDYISFVFYAPRKEKHFTEEWYNCSQKQLNLICDNVLKWDGNRDESKNRREFRTTIKESADFIQFAFSSTGQRASLRVRDRRGLAKKVNGKDYITKSIEYIVIVSKKGKSFVGLVDDRKKYEIKRIPSPDGYEYCFGVPSGNLVLRRKGKIFITHNTGKTEWAKIAFTYVMFKFLACEDLAEDFLNLKFMKGLYFAQFHRHKKDALPLAQAIRDIYDTAPCFLDLKQQMENRTKDIRILPARSAGDILSKECPCFSLSEINFIQGGDQKAMEIINACVSRLRGRFQKGMNLFNLFILDSSAVSATSPTVVFARESAYAGIVKEFSATWWDAKPHVYFRIPDPKTKKTWFEVYCGDTKNKPRILTPEDKKNELYMKGIDKDRIIKVPNEELPFFKTDIVKALQDAAGIDVLSSGHLFPDATVITPHFTLFKPYNDTMSLDYYDASTIMELPGVQEAVDKLPRNRKLIVAIDMGIKKDACGVAVGYCSNLAYKDVSGVKTPVMDIDVPIAFSLTRPAGQETNIGKIRDFILSLHSRIPVKTVGHDQYQSTHIAQEIRNFTVENYGDPKKTNIGIQTKQLSVDASSDYYLTFKRLLLEGRVKLPASDLLKKELLCLQYTKDNKIDHTKFVAVLGGGVKDAISVDSKDLADAVCRCVNIIYMLGDEACEDVSDSLNLSDNWTVQVMSAMDKERMTVRLLREATGIQNNNKLKNFKIEDPWSD